MEKSVRYLLQATFIRWDPKVISGRSDKAAFLIVHGLRGTSQTKELQNFPKLIEIFQIGAGKP